MATARGLVKDKPVKLVTEIEENLPIVHADATRVRQILLNLISNAAKFTDEGSITVSVRQRAGKDGKSELYLAITDTGTGIAEADQEKLFIPFSQVDGSPTRKVGGTGLGLSITRMLVELHGGEIGVISAEGKGSTFWFTLPVPDEASETGETHPPVLAIDDDPQVISLYDRYLGNAGYQVIAVTDPRNALIQAREIKPTVITLDIMMPDFDGWQLLKDLKDDPEVGHIPVVICSILEEQEKGLELGAADYLVKPILEEELVQAIEKITAPRE
jgi:CheY-like chemotaxis protein